VTDSHTTLRRSETRFDSWRGHGPCDRVPMRSPHPARRTSVKEPSVFEPYATSVHSDSMGEGTRWLPRRHVFWLTRSPLR
jgi:hypothetical protein